MTISFMFSYYWYMSWNESVTKYKCSIIQTERNTIQTWQNAKIPKYKHDKIQIAKIQMQQNTNTTKYKRTKYKCNKKQMQQNTNGTKYICKNAKIQTRQNTKEQNTNVT